MTVRRIAAAATGFAAAATAALGGWPATPASAHGAPVSPVSRTAACAQGGTELGSAICTAARKANGQPFGTFDNLRIANVDGRDREVVPDGQLCSGGLAAFRGLDLTGTDWPSTRLKAGAAFKVQYRAPIPHEGTFRIYLTKAGFNPDRALRWSDLDSKPILTVTDPPLRGGAYQMSGRLPSGRAGAHVLYTVWQTSSTPDTYYSCSDLRITAAAGAAAGQSGSGQSGNGQSGSGQSGSGQSGSGQSGSGQSGGNQSGSDAGGKPAAGGPADAGSPPGDQAGAADGAALDSDGGAQAAPDAELAAGRQSWLGPPAPTAQDRVGLGQQLISASLIVLFGVALALFLLRARASRAAQRGRQQPGDGTPLAAPHTRFRSADDRSGGADVEGRWVGRDWPENR